MLLLEPLDLIERLGFDLLRHAGFFDRCAQLLGERFLGRPLAQLLLDRADLLAQEVLALLLVETGLSVGDDGVAKRQHHQPLFDDHADCPEAIKRVERFHDLLALERRELRRDGDEVGQMPGLLDPLEHRQHILGSARVHADVVLDLLDQRGHRRLAERLRRDRVLVGDNLADHHRLFLDNLQHDAARDALQHDLRDAIRRPKLAHFGDDPDWANFVIA